MESASSQRIQVHIFQEFADCVTKTWLRYLAEMALSYQVNGEILDVSLVIADDETLGELNSRYRGFNETTDVLAFDVGHSWDEVLSEESRFFVPPEERSNIGEIVVSYPQAVRQAREHRKTVKAELSLLVVHGVLHLLGYEHSDPVSESLMWAKQDEILAMVAI